MPPITISRRTSCWLITSVLGILCLLPVQIWSGGLEVQPASAAFSTAHPGVSYSASASPHRYAGAARVPGTEQVGLDPSFGIGGVTTTDFPMNVGGIAFDSVVQPDGKILVVGYAVPSIGLRFSDFSIVRFNADGSLDTSFGYGGKVAADYNNGEDIAFAVALQPDGKILVGGFGSGPGGGNYDMVLVRYTSNGTLDSTFGTAGFSVTDMGEDDEIRALAVQSDGKILAGGFGGALGTQRDFALVRYNSNGSLDTSFDTDGIVTTNFDPDTNGDDRADDMILQGDGKIVLGGMAYIDGEPNFALARYNSNGSLDTSFSSDGKTTNFPGAGAESLTLQPDGKIVAGGSDAFNSSNSNFALARYDGNGSLDTSFDGDGWVTTDFFAIGTEFASGLAVQTDGKIVAAGHAGFTNKDLALARYNPNGSLDASFDGDGKLNIDILGTNVNDIGVNVSLLSGGKILAAAETWGNFALVRLISDGGLDPTFDGDGKAYTMVTASAEDIAAAVAIQPNGGIVVGGFALVNGCIGGCMHRDFALARYDSNGNLDQSFATSGLALLEFGTQDSEQIEELAVQNDGKIIAAGYTGLSEEDFALARFNPDGTLDTSFGDDGKVTTDINNSRDLLRAVAIAPDGKIVAGGSASNGSILQFALARYNTDGSLDTTFDTDGRVLTDFAGTGDRIYGVAVAPDGKVVAVGIVNNGSLLSDFAVARYNTDGSLDTTFDTDGRVLTDFAGLVDQAQSVALQMDGPDLKVVVGGFTGDSPQYNFALARYNPDGTLDESFDSDGKVTTDFSGTTDQAYGVGVSTDGLITAAGSSVVGATVDFALARYTSNGSLDPSFGNGGLITTGIRAGDTANDLAIDAQGRAVVAGYTLRANDFNSSRPDFALARYAPLTDSTPTPSVTASPTATLPAGTPTHTATGTAIATSTTGASATATTTSTRTATVPATVTATSTATATASATATAQQTPTACAVQFDDVPEGSTFYSFVRCLACRGILGGYPDNTFRPNNNVTRGQLAKIVSNSAGFTDPPGDQIFEDVVPGSTFYEFAQRLASREYMSGYPCGGVGEPCGPGNLPYFRPNNNATRAQISKIVSNAAGFVDPPGDQIFEDVVPGSTFYEFAQRLASRSIIGGYACGGVGEPCGVGNLPYFRPNNNATRGQTAKIVSNTFFAGCVTPRSTTGARR